MGFTSARALVAWLERSLKRMTRCERCRGKGVLLGIGARMATDCDACEGLGVTIT